MFGKKNSLAFFFCARDLFFRNSAEPILKTIRRNSLCYINLSGTFISDQSLGLLRDSPNLRYLSISGCPSITNKGFSLLNSLTKLKYVNFCDVEFVSENSIANFLENSRELKCVILSGCLVGEKVVEKLEGLKKLRYLSLARTEVRFFPSIYFLGQFFSFFTRFCRCRMNT